MNVCARARRLAFLEALAGGASVRVAACAAGINKNTGTYYARILYTCADCEGDFVPTPTRRGARSRIGAEYRAAGVSVEQMDEILQGWLNCVEVPRSPRPQKLFSPVC